MPAGLAQSFEPSAWAWAPSCFSPAVPDIRRRRAMPPPTPLPSASPRTRIAAPAGRRSTRRCAPPPGTIARRRCAGCGSTKVPGAGYLLQYVSFSDVPPVGGPTWMCIYDAGTHQLAGAWALDHYLRWCCGTSLDMFQGVATNDIANLAASMATHPPCPDGGSERIGSAAHDLEDGRSGWRRRLARSGQSELRDPPHQRAAGGCPGLFGGAALIPARNAGAPPRCARRSPEDDARARRRELRRGWRAAGVGRGRQMKVGWLDRRVRPRSAPRVRSRCAARARFPGQACASSAARLASDRCAGARSKRAHALARKRLASGPISSPPFTQRRYGDRDAVEAVEEVAPEAPGLDVGREIAVGRGDEAHVDGAGPHAAHAHDLRRLDARAGASVAAPAPARRSRRGRWFRRPPPRAGRSRRRSRR